MKLVRRVSLAFKALRQLGARQVGYYLWYQAGLRSGYLRWQTRLQRERVLRPFHDGSSPTLRPILPAIPALEQLANLLTPAGLSSLLNEADEIVAGRVRLFGREATPLRLEANDELRDWSEYREADFAEDIKFAWEAGRLGWAFSLCRAYRASADERYPQAFWKHFETFTRANPAYQGPHWMSAQEVALRLVALVFAGQTFAGSAHTTPERGGILARAVALHAARIPPTLAYAHAQNNNHLLSEAAGLYSAGLALPEHPEAKTWRKLGWELFQRGLGAQIGEDGAYIQQSTSYQRLMLQLALWMHALARGQGEEFPAQVLGKLAAATRWLIALVDEESGRVPNLGPQDGAYILPLAALLHFDYRPVVQAAAQAFLGERLYDPGPWDEMASWLASEPGTRRAGEAGESLAVIRPPGQRSWAYLRAARLRARPGHADQLHLDLWWRGMNIALDPGTYLYNAPPPWDNSLSGTGVHNTLTVNGCDQMLRAGRFLWLDWAQARLVERQKEASGAWERLAAEHDGYQRLGYLHRRAVTAYSDGRWLVEDDLLRSLQAAGANEPVTVRLHWLLPDWPWTLDEQGLGAYRLRLHSPDGWIVLSVSVKGQHTPSAHLARAGEVLHGNGPAAVTQGWVSPAYSEKIPALSFSVSVRASAPIQFASQWELPV